ncbi:epidermal growth factor receptor kinase substrate 8-like protein 3 [Grus japonensis]|uniref:Epidermal growth factor receptor kinase substrate 8-like protein 3 n=1 Tax=Grus japonensis TaxID=30415 RepID=A0ABC9XQ97_GRUJA
MSKPCRRVDTPGCVGWWRLGSARSEYDDSSPLRRSNSFARPSGKNIYNQRKDYGQTLLKPQSDFQHHVEHLLTVRLERDIRGTDDCLARLKVLEAQGRVWGQDLILQVKDQELVLRDVESKEELEAYPLGSVQGCSAALDVCGYDSVLAISVQERSPPGTSVLLFQCERLGAETLKSSLEKLMKQWKEEQRSQYGHRSSLDMPPRQAPLYAQGPYAAPERWAETPKPNVRAPPQRELPSDYGLLDTQQMPWTNPLGQVMSDVDRDVEVLNHVLNDLDLFVVQLKTALGLASNTKQEEEEEEEEQRRTHRHVQEPDPAELLRLIFTALSFVLDHCPNASLAPAVEVPLLVPEAVELLEQTLHQDDYSTWKSLGIAWNSTRAEYPNGELVPRYIPVFSDGWLPPPVEQSPATGQRDNGGQEPPRPAQGLARSLYEFQGRNPQELSVRMGDTLQILDQRKKWWLVQDGQGKKGYIPSNILEPLGQWQGPSQDSPPNLHPDSSPAEVTAWLKDKGFSRM